MQEKSKTIKITLVSVMIAVITILHYTAIHGHAGLHILHRELYFVPILLASFWFGLKPGLAVSILITIIYAPHVFIYKDPHGTLLAVGSQVLVFNAVAGLLGWLTDRQKRQQKEVQAVENITLLGRAAGAVGHEMSDILAALKRLVHTEEKLRGSEPDRNFDLEMARLERMVETLSSFVPQEKVVLISRDFNEIIRNRIEALKEDAQKAGVHLEAQLDEIGCPSMVDTDKVSRILDDLIKNALEVSSRGKHVYIRSSRGGDFCRVEIQDQGPGIQPEHLSKIFTPFFTTKKRGQGLALAVAKKLMKDLGGDIRVESKPGKGATFTLLIPREDPGRSLPGQVVMP